MSKLKETAEFWLTEGLKHIKPRVGGEFPEGWDVRDTLTKLVENNKVVEFGCGYGRLVGKFNPDQYTGYDINPKAIEEAISLHPLFNFHQYNLGDTLTSSEYVIFYTVLLHIPDDGLVDLLRVTTQNTNCVIVGEILGRKWRRDGNPPVFNRELKEYTKAFEEVGFYLDFTITKPYKRYKDTDVTFLIFRQ